jgi:hypothetical protein
VGCLNVILNTVIDQRQAISWAGEQLLSSEYGLCSTQLHILALISIVRDCRNCETDWPWNINTITTKQDGIIAQLNIVTPCLWQRQHCSDLIKTSSLGLRNYAGSHQIARFKPTEEHNPSTTRPQVKSAALLRCEVWAVFARLGSSVRVAALYGGVTLKHAVCWRLLSRSVRIVRKSHAGESWITQHMRTANWMTSPTLLFIVNPL